MLADYGPAGTTIAICNRDLARLAGCSAGAIPGALRTLAADGYIERITSPQGSLIVVSDQDADRSAISDQIPDRTESADRASVADRSPRSDQHVDPPTPPIRYKQQNQQQQRGAIVVEREPLYRRLMQEPGMSASLAERATIHAPGDLAAFEADLAAAPGGLRVKPIFWLTAIWARGQRPARRARTSAPPRRSTAAPPEPAARPPLPVFQAPAAPAADPAAQRAKLAAYVQEIGDFHAFLASRAAAQPGGGASDARIAPGQP